MSAAEEPDRLARGYQPNFDIDYRKGHEGEKFAQRIADGIANGTIEVKTDEMAVQTGNVYVEFKCLKFGEYVPSGIAVTTSETWLYVLSPNLAVAVNVELLKAVARLHHAVPSRRRGCTRGSHPTKGVLIPLNEFLRSVMLADTA